MPTCITFGNIQLDGERCSLQLVKRCSSLWPPGGFAEIEDEVDYSVSLNPCVESLVISHPVKIGAPRRRRSTPVLRRQTIKRMSRTLPFSLLTLFPLTSHLSLLTLLLYCHTLNLNLRT